MQKNNQFSLENKPRIKYCEYNFIIKYIIYKIFRIYITK